MMLKVDSVVPQQDAHGEWQRHIDGTLFWDGKNFTTSPPNSEPLLFILKHPVYDSDPNPVYASKPSAPPLREPSSPFFGAALRLDCNALCVAAAPLLVVNHLHFRKVVHAAVVYGQQAHEFFRLLTGQRQEEVIPDRHIKRPRHG
jgi:hypothetical protein